MGNSNSLTVKFVEQLRSMRHAAAVLLSVLDTVQQRKAMEVLPLCCLPTTEAG